MTTFTSHIHGHLSSVLGRIGGRLQHFRLPWEISTLAASWVSYAYIMLIILILSTQVACAAIQSGNGAAGPAPLSGQAELVFFREVMLEIQGIASGAGNGMILHNPANRILVFAWPHSSGYAFLCLDTTRTSFLNAIRAGGSRGAYVNIKDFESLISGAMRIGYRQIQPADLIKVAPAMLTSILETAASTASSTLPNIMLVPVMPGMFEMPGAPVSAIQ